MKHRATLLAAALVCAAVAGAAGASQLVRRQAPIALTFLAGDGIVASVWTDPDTGCEYLVRGDNIVPRLGPDGRPRCAGPGPVPHVP